jgi:DNA excision repair protein ERCC-4
VQKGFIKAFTEYPERFNAGFLKLEKVLKSMLLTKVYLWPRFRDTVNSCLDAHRPDVVELHQPLSPLAHKIQTSILEIMDACITEIQKTNMVDLPDYKVEDGLFKEFDTLIRSQLDPGSLSLLYNCRLNTVLQCGTR